jgi:hypothetical protein
VIPWTTILKHAPTILSAADTLLARARATDAKRKGLAERVAGLEQQ